MDKEMTMEEWKSVMNIVDDAPMCPADVLLSTMNSGVTVVGTKFNPNDPLKKDRHGLRLIRGGLYGK